MQKRVYNISSYPPGGEASISIWDSPAI